jgi:hypothetical protein
MINNYLISLLICLGVIAAGLGSPRVDAARRYLPSPAGAIAVILGVVAAVLVIVNWAAST